MVRTLKLDDIPSWLEIVKEVEPLFGKMIGVPEFETGIKLAIEAKCVFGYEDENKILCGAVAINREENSIEWLAVKSEAKGKGIGNLLIEKSLSELEQSKDVLVQTFTDNIPEGKAARNLYLKYGFIDFQDGGKNPAGIDTIIMKRNRNNHIK